MKNWMKQQTTIAGFLGVAITGVQAYQSGGDWATVALAVLSAALLWIKSDQAKNIFAFLVLSFAVSSQACASIPIPKSAQVAAAVPVACAIVDATGCYKELQGAFPGIDKASCTQVVDNVLKLAENAKEIYDRNTTIYGEELNKMMSTIQDGQIDLGHWDPLSVVDPRKIAAMRNGKCSKLVKSLGVK
jgi:hypothetical protein